METDKDVITAIKLDKSKSLRGVNLNGAEFGNMTTANVYGTHWRWPLEQEWEYTALRNHKLVRLAFRWERMQPTLSGSLDSAQIDLLNQQLEWADTYGLKVILDNHNYAKYNEIVMGAVNGPTYHDLADFWQRMSVIYGWNSAVVGYGLNNEPSKSIPSIVVNGQTLGPKQHWYKASQEALNAIRSSNGDVTAVISSGWPVGVVNAWQSSDPLQNNGVPWLTDPANNFIYEAHSYFDELGSYTKTYAEENTKWTSWGTTAAYDSITKAYTGMLKKWLDWGVSNNVRLFLGEVGWPRAVAGRTNQDTQKWNLLADAYYSTIDLYGANVWVTQFSGGSALSPEHSLRSYLDDYQSRGRLVAPSETAWPIEAHLTR